MERENPNQTRQTLLRIDVARDMNLNSVDSTMLCATIVKRKDIIKKACRSKGKKATPNSQKQKAISEEKDDGDVDWMRLICQV